MKIKNIFHSLIFMISWPIYAMEEQIIGFALPDDPNVCVPEITYHSPFQDYQPQRPIKLKSWRKANESAAKLPMHGMQNMPMENAPSDMKQGSGHSNHQMKGSE